MSNSKSDWGVHPHAPKRVGKETDDRTVLQTLEDPALPGWRVRIVQNKAKHSTTHSYAVLLDYHWLDGWYRSRLQLGYDLLYVEMFDAMAGACHWLEKAREASRVREHPLRGVPPFKERPSESVKVSEGP